jgi:hypothetical protein
MLRLLPSDAIELTMSGGNWIGRVIDGCEFRFRFPRTRTL